MFYIHLLYTSRRYILHFVAMTLIQKPLVFLLILPWVLLFAMKPPKAPAGLISKKIANRVYVPAGNWNQVALLLSSALAPSGNAPQRVPSGAPDNFSATELIWGAPHSKALHLIKSQTAIPQDSLSITVSGPVTVINCNSYKADQARAFIRYFKKLGLKIKKDVDELVF